MAAKIEGSCQEVRRYLRVHGQNRRRSFTEYIHPRPLPRGWQACWTGSDPGHAPRQGPGGPTRRELHLQWVRQWRSRREPWGELYPRPPERRNLLLYQGLTKACCSILIQLRTGKTGLAAFLHRRRVPGYNSPCCPCGSGAAETPKHILVHCPRFQGARTGLEDSGRVNLDHLLCTGPGARVLSRWWLNQGILHQFGLARALELGQS